MIYIEVDNNQTVIYENHKPFDEVHGLGKTEEELKNTGFLVEERPNPEQNGKGYLLKYDKDSNKLFYTYFSKPVLTTEEKLQQLEQDLGFVLFENALDKAKISELEMSQGDLLMEIAMLKMGGSF